MVTQSRAQPVPLLLTRPEVQGADFAARLSSQFGDRVAIIKTPLLKPRFFAPILPQGRFSAMILTSQTGVEGYVRLGLAYHLPKEVFCVGEHTASAARAALLFPVAVAKDAASLIAQISALKPKGALLHLRGRETRGDICSLLISAGIETIEAVIYGQDPLPLSDAATKILDGNPAVLVPLFSPRTAALFTAGLARIAVNSPLLVAAMSNEVALAACALGAQIKVAKQPDAAAMIDVIALFLTELQRA